MATDTSVATETPSLPDPVLDELATHMRGTVIRPGDEQYDAARRVWNGMINRYPAVIVRCAGVADIIAAVTYAREHGLTVAVRGGGHNVAGNATCDGGMVIDLSTMKGIRVDPNSRTVRAEPGVVWREFDHETQVFGLATPGGLVSSTGVAGFTLGGGIGWLTRKHGLACDNLTSVDVVTADGALVTASPIQNADLFWGIRGGGGNFGIVASFEFQLHTVGPMVIGGAVFHALDRAHDLLRFYRDFAAGAPNELTSTVVFMTAPPLPFLPEELHGKPVIAIAACYAGDMATGEAAVRPLQEFGPPAGNVLGPIPYTVLQSMFDEDSPAGQLHYWKSHYVQSLTDEVVEQILDRVSAMPGPLTQLHMHQLRGAAAHAPKEGVAYGHRDAAYALNILGICTEPADADAQISWVRNTWAALEPFSSGIYVNFLADDGAASVRASYDEESYTRLVALKRKYDPTNFFQLNQNIKP